MGLSDLMISFLWSRFIILLSILTSCTWRLSFRFSNQYIVCISQFFNACYKLHPFYFPLPDNFSKSKNREVPQCKFLNKLLVFLCLISEYSPKAPSFVTVENNGKCQRLYLLMNVSIQHVSVTPRLTLPASRYNEK